MITLRIFYSSTYRTLLQFSPKFWLEYDKIKATLSPKANTYLPRGFMFQYNLCIVWWCAIGALNCELFAFDIVLFMKGWPNGPCELSLNNTWAQEKQCSMEKKVLAVTDYWRYIILQYILCTTFLFVTVVSLHLKFVNNTLSEPCSKLLKLMSEFFTLTFYNG